MGAWARLIEIWAAPYFCVSHRAYVVHMPPYVRVVCVRVYSCMPTGA